MAGVRLIIQFTAENAAEAEKQVAGMAERCKKAQQEPGCLQFEVFRSALEAQKYALLEHWASEEALETHRQNMPPGNPQASNITRTREHYEQQFA
ncbi:MAG TPA: antibiotic biosynthesis monooxygenase [Chloroflexota bacterium]|nr:antibiotic biosynthesis monooxygenase [Chloroflexota bacterium]